MTSIHIHPDDMQCTYDTDDHEWYRPDGDVCTDPNNTGTLQMGSTLEAHQKTRRSLFVVEVESVDPPFKGTVGPFNSRQTANDNVSRRVKHGSWNVVPLHYPHDIDDPHPDK